MLTFVSKKGKTDYRPAELVRVSPPTASFSGLLAGLRLLFGFASTVIHFLAMEKSAVIYHTEHRRSVQPGSV